MNKTLNAYTFLQLSLALMFIALGILGINGYNSGGAELIRGINKAFGGSNDVIPIIIAVVELLAGAVLVISLFVPISRQLLSILLIVIFIFWAVNIAMAYVLDGLFEPSLVKWLASVAPQLVILMSLWIIYRKV